MLSNKPGVAGLERAQKANIDVACLEHQDFPERPLFDAALVETLQPYHPDLIILAGFMRILTTVFTDYYAGRMLNIHPSLLPKYPGLDTHQQVIDAGERWHGSTVHFVTEQLDGGPAIMQGRVAVMPDDSATTLAARVLTIEHRIYPKAAALYASGRLKCRNGAAWLDGERLDGPIQYAESDMPRTSGS